MNGGNIKVESNLVRVELVFLERMLDRMYSGRKSLEDILTRKAIRTLIDQYQVTFDEICETHIKVMLNNCVQEVFESLTCSDSGNEISDTLIRCKELIVDMGEIHTDYRRSGGILPNRRNKAQTLGER